jgi:hypothetical protein
MSGRFGCLIGTKVGRQDSRGETGEQACNGGEFGSRKVGAKRCLSVCSSGKVVVQLKTRKSFIFFYGIFCRILEKMRS